MPEIPFEQQANLGEAVGRDRMQGLQSISQMDKRFPGIDSLLTVGVMNMTNGGTITDEASGQVMSIGAEPIEIDGQIMLAPTVWKGKRLTPQQAEQNARRMMEEGHMLPKFATRAQAESVREMVKRDFMRTKDYLIQVYPRVEQMRKMVDKKKKVKPKGKAR